MRTYSLISRFLYRGKKALERINDSFSKYVLYKMSRDKAKRLRNTVVGQKGGKVVDRRLMKIIKEYCTESFGSASYWPWLALYTELRGEFKEGWIPDDYYRFELLPRLNPEKYMRFSEAKIMDHKLFKNFIIEPLFYRSNGQYFCKDDTFITNTEVVQLLNDLDEEIIVKPEAGHGGQGITFHHSKNLNLDKLPSDSNLLFQKVVKQHPELNRLNPNSVNTYRVLTYLDHNGEIEIKFVILRFGIGSARLDNASSGGGFIFINLNGEVHSNAYDINALYFGKKHPDTNVKYSDLKPPSFDKVIDLCKKAHKIFPYTRIIGWDVYVNEMGDAKLIEWNANNPGIYYAEAHYGPCFKCLV